VRCPSCNASLRPDALWCSLCHHDLRPPAPVAPVIPAPTYGGPDPLTAPLLDVLLPPVPQAVAPAVQEQAPVPAAATDPATWPCTACGATNPLSLDVCSACGSRFLALASEMPSLVVPGVGDLQQLSRGHRVAVAAGFLAAILIPLALITFLLTGEPPKGAPGGGGTETTITTVGP